MDKIIYLNGEYISENNAKISVFDHGLLYGDGVFEGIRVYSGKIFKCKEHIDRLFSAAKAIMLDIPLSKEDITNIIIQTCRLNHIEEGYIRLVVTRGKGKLGINPNNCEKPSIFCITDKISMYLKEMYTNGISIITSNQRRNNATIIDPQIKSLNYLNNILAKIEANQAGVEEALMLNQDGIVTECTGDNIFLVKNNEIITPPIHTGILDGITRNVVMEIASKLGYRVAEKEFTLFNVYNSDECFLTGTAAEIIPVSKVDNRIIGSGRTGIITDRIILEFKKYTKMNGIDIY